MYWYRLYKYRHSAWLVIATLVAWGTLTWLQKPVYTETTQPQNAALTLPSFPDIELFPIKVFVPEESSSDSAKLAELVNKRFRLAGTYQVFNKQDVESQKAIVDDTERKRQRILSEGEAIAELKVTKIYSDYLEVEYKGTKTQLYLSYASGFSANTAPVTSKEEAREKGPTTFDHLPALEENQFGKRVGENRWVLKREALVDYYNEMLNNPESLANLYMSFKPDYSIDEKIAGYQLDIVGEKDFLTQMGLKPNDLVRKVNSMNMTSQRRAEYFIGSFARNEMTAMVIDIERDGKAEKLVYMFR